MSQKMIVEITDDISGETGAGPVMFGLDGTSYEIDLSPDHERELRATLARYIDQARKTGKRPGRIRVISRPDLDEIRTWARARGLARDRGRVPAAAITAYDQARAAANGPERAAPGPVAPSADGAAPNGGRAARGSGSPAAKPAPDGPERAAKGPKMRAPVQRARRPRTEG
jgi:hypothetical protein